MALATTNGDAAMTLAALHRIESRFGRVRGIRNEARVLDMDLLDFNGQLSQNPSLMLPHPRMHKRLLCCYRFVNYVRIGVIQLAVF